jgi:hypothetical protein
MDESKREERRRALAKKVLDRIASDPQFREQLLDSPHQAMDTAGYAHEIRELQDSEGEVSGYYMRALGFDALLLAPAPVPVTLQPQPPGHEVKPPIYEKPPEPKPKPIEIPPH